MDSCRGARPSSTATSSEISAPLLPPAPPQPCPPVAAASTKADALESSPSALSFAPLSRDSRPWRDQLFLIAFLAALAVLCVLCFISTLLESPGLSTTLVALSYARIVVAVVAAAPLVWAVLLYVRRRNSLTVVLPVLLALVALLFFLGAFLILLLPRLLSSLLHTSAGPVAVVVAAAAGGAAASSHGVAAIGTLAAATVTVARALMMDGVSSLVDATAVALTPSLAASISSASPLTRSRLASPPLSDSLSLLFSSSLSPNNSTPLTSPPGIPSVIPSPFLSTPFPRMSVLVSPFLSSPLGSSVSPPLLAVESNHFIVHYSFLFFLLGLAMLLLLSSRPLKRLSLSLLRRTASLLLAHSQSVLFFVLLLLLLQVLVTAPPATVIRKVVTVCSVAAVEGEMTIMCQAWLLFFLWILYHPLFLLLGLWAVVVFSMLIALLVAALVGHGLSAEEEDYRDDIRRGKHAVEAAHGDHAATVAYPAIAGAGGIAAVAVDPMHPAWPARAPHLPAVTGIAPRPRFPQLPLLGQALRFALTRSLGTAAAVALLIVVSYVLFTALNYWLAVYVFATLEVPGLLTGTAAVLLTVAQLMVLQLLIWFVLPVAGITGKGVCASLAMALRLLPAHLLPSLALFVCARLLVVALATIAQALLRLLAFVLTPSPLSASHEWIVAASFMRLFLSSILSTALSTLTLSLLAAVPAVYIYLALGERLDAHTGVVLGPQENEKEEAEEGGVRVIEV